MIKDVLRATLGETAICQCDFCNTIINDGFILRYRRSIFEFLKVTSKVLWGNFYINCPYGKLHLSKTKYHLCGRCKAMIKERIFAEPNIVEELQHLCQNNVRMPARQLDNLPIRRPLAATAPIFDMPDRGVEMAYRPTTERDGR